MKKSKSKYINMGCRLNIYEGEVIKSLVENQNISDITIINSCNVTEQAEKKVAYQIRKAKKDNPKNKIILTGCAAQINPQKYFNDKNVDYIFGNREKLQKETWLKQFVLWELHFLKVIGYDLELKNLVNREIIDGKKIYYVKSNN